MKSRYAKFLGLFAIVYIALHLCVTVLNNGTVEDRRQITNPKESDGPLIMRDLPKSEGNVLR